MSIQDSQIIPKKHSLSLAELRAKNRKRFVQFGLPLLFIVIISSVLPGGYTSGSGQSPVAAKIQELDADTERYLLWLKFHGTQSEISLYYFLSDRLISSVAEGALNHDQSKMAVYLLGGVSGMLRVLFLIIASARLWILLFAAVVFTSFRNWKPYEGADLLGVTGNGKLFFSGIFTKLSRVREGGVPDLFIPGLACPKMRSISEVTNSKIGSLLRDFQALNHTTGALTGILLAYPEFPFFAATSETQERLSSFSDPSLIEGARVCLEAALSVHQAISGKGAANKAAAASKPASTVSTVQEYSAVLRK